MVLRMRDLVELLGICRSTIYKLRKAGDFPEPVKVGPRSIGWRRADIEEWLEGRERVDLRP